MDAFGKQVIDLYVGRPRRTYEAHLEVAAAAASVADAGITLRSSQGSGRKSCAS